MVGIVGLVGGMRKRTRSVRVAREYERMNRSIYWFSARRLVGGFVGSDVLNAVTWS